MPNSDHLDLRNRPFLELRINTALDPVLQRMIADEAEVARSARLGDYWKLHLAKRGFTATWSMLDRVADLAPPETIADLRRRALAVCGHDDEEYAYLQALAPKPWVSNRLLQHDLRNGRVDTALQRILRWKQTAGPGFLPAAVDGLWAIGAAEVYDGLRPHCDRVPGIDFYDRVFATWQAPSDHALHHMVLFIGRDTRRAILTRVGFASVGVSPEFVHGLDGAFMARQLLTHLQIERGQFGCANSHMLLWERVVGGADPGAIIFEVDAAPTVNQSEAALALHEWDFVTLNDRAHAAPIRDLDCRDIRVLDAIPFERQFGSDGYYISRRFAEYLLAVFARDGLRGHVDMQVFDYMRQSGFGVDFRFGRTSFPLVRHLQLGAGTRRVVELDY